MAGSITERDTAIPFPQSARFAEGLLDRRTFTLQHVDAMASKRVRITQGDQKIIIGAIIETLRPAALFL